MAVKSRLAPSATIIADARPVKVITDVLGRSISYRSLTVLEQARLLRAVGSENSNNVAFVGLAMMAAAVVDIDGVPSPRVANLVQVDAAIERLGDGGYVAMYAALGDDDNSNADLTEEVAAAKN